MSKMLKNALITISTQESTHPSQKCSHFLVGSLISL